MYASIWSVVMARAYALDSLQEMIARNEFQAPQREPRRHLRKLLGRGLGAAGRGLVRLGDGLANRPGPRGRSREALTLPSLRDGPLPLPLRSAGEGF